MKECRITALLSVFLMSVSSTICYSAWKEPVPFGGIQWPVARAEEVFFGPGVFKGAEKTYFIEAATDVPLAKLVDFSIFHDFRPGMTYDQAIARYGPPSWTRTEKVGKTAVYELPTARIEIEDHSYPGSFFMDYERRTVYAYPKPLAGGCLPASTILISAVNDFVSSDISAEYHIMDADCLGSEAVFVYVKNGCVRAINWVKIDGTGISTDVCK